MRLIGPVEEEPSGPRVRFVSQFDAINLPDAARELMEHLEEFCGWPTNDRERKLSRQVYAALGDPKEKL